MGGPLSLEDPLNRALGQWALDLPGSLSPGRQGLLLGPQGCANTGQLFFGDGSKLTVLGKEDSRVSQGVPWGWMERGGQLPSSIWGCAQKLGLAPGPATPAPGAGCAMESSWLAGPGLSPGQQERAPPGFCPGARGCEYRPSIFRPGHPADRAR